jgi:hypothetical protein
MSEEPNPLEKGTTTIPAWVSSYDKKLLKAIQKLDTGVKPASASYLFRLCFLSTAHRVLSGAASLKQVKDEALTIPTGISESGVK